MATSALVLTNGLPIMTIVTGTTVTYDESIYYSSGLAASTTITLPGGGTFADSAAKDMWIILNDLVKEVTRDFTVIGAGPEYTQIQFGYALPNDAIVRFKGLTNATAAYDESIYYSSGLSANINITLPNSGSFTDSSAKNLFVIINGTVKELTRDFEVVGSGPTYTQIKFIYALPNDAVLRFRYNL